MPIKSLRTLYLLPLVFFIAINCGCADTKYQALDNNETIKSTEAPLQNNNKEKPTVVILATGGTIAGTGEKGKSTNYKPGQLNVEDLVESAGLSDIANIKGEQICNINSDDITDEIWLKIAKRINTLASDRNISGFVITHGTDTLDETAYFLNLVLKTQKPVVITGSMRPATALSADGPLNLHQAVALAISPKAYGQGVLAVISDRIYGARNVRKISTFNVNAFSEGDFGCLGYIIDDKVLFFNKSVKAHTINTEFDINNINTLPKVGVLYFNVDADADIIESYAKNGYKGLVIAGAGSGEYSQKWHSAIKRHPHLVVVRSSRVDSGYVSKNDGFDSNNVIAGGDLKPQKAAILLRLALTKTQDINRILEMFSKY